MADEENALMLLGESTLRAAVKAARVVVDGGTAEKAATSAGVDTRTLRRWKNEPWWPQLIAMVQAELREALLGKALGVLHRKLEDEDVGVAMFVAKMFLVDTVKTTTKPGRPTKAQQFAHEAVQQAANNLTPAQAKAMLEAEEADYE